MTFDSKERSRQKAEPAELYLFRYGDSVESRLAYTDAEEDITFGGIVYKAVPIKRGAITASGSLDKAALEVRTSKSSEIVSVLSQSPSYVILLTIRQGHRLDPSNEWLVSWTGRVLGLSGEGKQSILACEPTSTSSRRIGLRRHYQYGCPHALYGDQCRASRPAATVAVEIVELGGIKVRVADGFNTQPLNKYLGGLLQIQSQGQTVLKTIRKVTDRSGIDGTVELLLNGKLPISSVGDPATVSLGCAHDMTDCRTLHVPVDEPVTAGGNIHNYGGQPFIPNRNPIGIVNEYY